MTTLFAIQSRRVLASLADELGCAPERLTSESLEVVVRPASRRPGQVVLAATCGLGTILSVPAAVVGWVRDNAPGTHFRAMQPFFLAEVAAEIGRRGIAPGATAYGFSQGFALSELQPVPEAPAGHSLVSVEPGWMARYRPSNVFDNALGAPNESDRIEKTLRGFAALDSAGEPAAVAGWWSDGHGREEIGVDVRREARGSGLAKLVVIAATHAIIDAGGSPFYSCGVTNIRSHRNALACGFLPAFLTGSVWAPPEPPGP